MRFPIAIYRVAERSMEPAIEEGSYLFVSAVHGRLRKGDIVLLRHPSSGIPIVKRIRSLEGKRLFVEGDNKTESEDSRKFGTLPVHNLVGKVIMKL